MSKSTITELAIFCPHCKSKVLLESTSRKLTTLCPHCILFCLNQISEKLTVLCPHYILSFVWTWVVESLSCVLVLCWTLSSSNLQKYVLWHHCMLSFVWTRLVSACRLSSLFVLFVFKPKWQQQYWYKLVLAISKFVDYYIYNFTFSSWTKQVLAF